MPPNISHSMNPASRAIDSNYDDDSLNEFCQMQNKSHVVTNITDLGYPGFLSANEFAVFKKFRDYVFDSCDDVQDTVFPFAKAHEEESYALCRWLRARKFNLCDSIKMIEEAAKCTNIPRVDGFYPSSHSALGVESSTYVSQYPQMYHGHARNKCPVFYSKPGVLNVDGIECITTLKGIIKYHWYSMMHEYVHKLRDQYLASLEDSQKDFKRYECVCVLDLKHLTTAQMSKRSLNIIQLQADIDSLCFPETLNRMIVINAPSFFTFTWKLMRKWVDSRTANKVEIFGSTWKERLEELIDVENLPSEYGGTRGASMEASIHCQTLREHELLDEIRGARKIESIKKFLRQDNQLMNVRNNFYYSFKLEEGEIMTYRVFTRSLVGAYFSISDTAGLMIPCIPQNGILIKHNGKGNPEEDPTCINLCDSGVFVKDAGSFQIKMNLNGGIFSSDYFLLVINVFAIQTQSDNRDLKEIKSSRKEKINANKLCESQISIENCEMDVIHDDTMLISPAQMSRRKKRNKLSKLRTVADEKKVHSSIKEKSFTVSRVNCGAMFCYS